MRGSGCCSGRCCSVRCCSRRCCSRRCCSRRCCSSRCCSSRASTRLVRTGSTLSCEALRNASCTRLISLPFQVVMRDRNGHNGQSGNGRSGPSDPHHLFATLNHHVVFEQRYASQNIELRIETCIFQTFQRCVLYLTNSNNDDAQHQTNEGAHRQHHGPLRFEWRGRKRGGIHQFQCLALP